MLEEALDTEQDVEDTDLEDEVEDEETDEDHVFTVKDETDEPDEDEPDKPSETEVKFEDLQKQFDSQAEEMGKLKTELETRDKEISRIAYQLRTAKKDTKPTDETAEYTDAQLQGLLEEHRDDPAAMLQIMRLVSEQTSKKGKQDTLDEVQVTSNKKEMDEFLTKTYPDLADEGSDFRRDVNNMKAYLGMEDHPYGDYLGVATMVLNQLENIIAHSRKEGKNEALKGQAEEGRKKGIKSGHLSSVTGKKKTSSVASSRYVKTAKQMGLSPAATKRYLQAMADKNSTVDGEG